MTKAHGTEGKSVLSFKASEIAQFLNARLSGEDIDIFAPASLKDDMATGSVSFTNGKKPLPGGYDLNGSSLLLVPSNKAGQMPTPHIVVANPRLAFAKVLSEFFAPQVEPGVHATASIEEGAVTGSTPHIGAFAHIGAEVVLGDNVVVGTQTVIVGRTTIGDRTMIRSNTVVGESGFGFEKDDRGIPQRIPHIGGVHIGTDCEIGALNTIVSGTIDPTIIKDHVKTDDHVHIAHNCEIGNRVIITAGAIFSGSVHVGDDVWIGPNASIINGIRIGENAFIGLGAVITKDVPPNTTMGAVRARPVAAK